MGCVIISLLSLIYCLSSFNKIGLLKRITKTVEGLFPLFHAGSIAAQLGQRHEKALVGPAGSLVHSSNEPS
jgi:hypothetical protein